MKIHNMEQGSNEWEEIRKGKITASTFNTLVTSTLGVSKSIASKLAISQIIGNEQSKINSDDFQTYAMARGTDCEPRARDWYQKTELIEVQEVGFIEHESGLAGFSPDGLVADGMIEIKTQCQKNHMYCDLFGFDEWLKKYKPQILLSMVVNESIKFCDCISYNEDFEGWKKMFIFRYERNEEEVKKAKESLEYWINFLKDIKYIKD